MLAGAAWALVAFLPATPAELADWKRIGGTGVSAGLAGPVGRPVDDAWFSADGRRLYARLQGGALWASEDGGGAWRPAQSVPGEPRAAPDPQDGFGGSAKVLRNPYRTGVLYALGEHLYRSDDGGAEWTNLTAVGGESVIGRWQDVLAISPTDPELVAVGNAMGLWQSHDAGVTWSSLNGALPNFPPARFLPSGAGTSPSLEADSLGTLELVRTAGGTAWLAADGRLPPRRPPPRPERAPRPSLPDGYDVSNRVWRHGEPLSDDLTECRGRAACAGHSIVSFASNGQLWAGTSNGRIWVSSDDGATWSLSWTDPAEGDVTSIWADTGAPASALALAGGHLLRSTNGGASWLDISSNLPPARWTAVEGHPEAGAAYVAGPRGVFFAHVDLRQPGPPGEWNEIGGNLPSTDIGDLALEPLRGRIYVALPGHGVYWTRTPQVESALRALSAADLSERPAAPGSLLTIFGTKALRARADGRPAPILDAAQGRTQLQVPFAVRGRSVQLRLDASEASHVLELPLREVSPALFVVAGEPLILQAGTGALVGWNVPAPPGSSVLVMATGLGEVEPPWPAGLPSPHASPPRAVARIEAAVGSSAAAVRSAHLAPGYVGIYLVEVAVPADTPPGRACLVLRADGRASNAVDLIIGR